MTSSSSVAVTPGCDPAIVLCACARDLLCDRCVADTFAQLCGVAACRGEAWAGSVRRRVPARGPWPAHGGREAEIARRKVTDLTRDTRLGELLVAELSCWAAKRWAQLDVM